MYCFLYLLIFCCNESAVVDLRAINLGTRRALCTKKVCSSKRYRHLQYYFKIFYGGNKGNGFILWPMNYRKTSVWDIAYFYFLIKISIYFYGQKYEISVI